MSKTQTQERINWKISLQDAKTIGSIVDRAKRELKHVGDALSLEMDLIACHNNGCPLKLDALLKFPPFDFAHDIYGIRNHINRKNGKIENCFLPRCAQ